MAIDQAERPQFYEGQYLGAADLAAIVEHGRVQRARHDLGAHSWGIATGLTLREQPGPNGTLDLYLLPGSGWDGFGRPIVVTAPYRLPVELFKPLVYDAQIDGGTPAGRLVDVWLRYDETPTQPPRRGFERCDPDTPFGRVQEGFRVEIGARPNLSDVQDRIVAGDYALYANEVLQTFDPPAPPNPPRVLYDESVPFQQFPGSGERRRWLIGLGAVRWLPHAVAGQPGRFVARAPADLTYSASLRRTIGVIAGAVQAAEGVIRLRARTRPYLTALSDDLVWVEGSLRAEGDVRLFGSKVTWVTAGGQDLGVPLEIRRAQNNAAGETMIQVAIGAAAAGKHRFAVGPLVAGANPGDPPVVDEKLVVRDDGKVGIGTRTPAPALRLDVQGDLGRVNGPATLHLWGSQIGDVGGGTLFVRSGGNVVAFDGGDSVGVGTTAPRNPLAVRGGGPSEELVSFEDTAGATKWHINQKVNNTPGLNIAETNVGDGRIFLQPGGNVGIGTTAPALRLDVQGDFGRNNGPTTAHFWASQVGDAGGGVLFLRSGGSVVAFDGNDRVGIGTAAPDPALKLDVQGDFGRANGAATLSLFGSRIGDIGDGVLFLRSGGNVVAFDGNDRVGIRTNTPLYPLHVNGSAYKSDGPFWSSLSDVRLKKDIAPLTGALERLLRLRGVTFAWQDPEKVGGRSGPQIGLVAQEVEEVLPEWVDTGPDGMKLINTRGLEALLVEALRQLEAENEALRSRLDASEARLSTLEARLSALEGRLGETAT